MAAAAVNLWWWPPQVPATSCGANKFRLHLRTSSTSGCWLSTDISTASTLVYGHLLPASSTSTVFIRFRISPLHLRHHHLLPVSIFSRLHHALRVYCWLWTVSKLGDTLPANWAGADTFSSRLLTDRPFYCMHVVPYCSIAGAFVSELFNCHCWSHMDVSTLHLLCSCTVWHCLRIVERCQLGF